MTPNGASARWRWSSWIRNSVGDFVEAAEEALRAHVRSYTEKGVISKLAVPDRIVIVKDLPLTSVGKVDKKVLREKYQREEAA